MKRKCRLDFRKIFILIFMGIVFLPGTMMLLGVDFYSDENRTLSKKPEFDLTTILSYPDKYTAYYEDHLPFKELLVEWNAFLNWKLFNVSLEKAVIIGKDGWLFYNSKYKEQTDTVQDYTAPAFIEQDQLAEYREMLIKMKEVCEGYGAKFIFMVAPNKMSIYGDAYMPEIYVRDSNYSRTDMLIDYLRTTTDICILYPKEELISNAEQFPLYYKLDSHWNELGGYIGYSQLYEEVFGEQLPSLEMLEYEETIIASGDLARMSKIKDLTDKNISIPYKPNTFVSSEEFKDGFRSTSDSKSGKRLLMFRDSFAIAMEKFITKDFETADLQWTPFFDEGLIMQECPDIVVYEVVERSALEISGLDHRYLNKVEYSTLHDKEQFPEHSSPEVAGYCVPEIQDNILSVYGWSFVTGRDSADTKAYVCMVGDKVYTAPVDLTYREDVAKAYSEQEFIDWCGIQLACSVDELENGNYQLYIVLENGSDMYFYNLNYTFSK